MNSLRNENFVYRMHSNFNILLHLIFTDVSVLRKWKCNELSIFGITFEKFMFHLAALECELVAWN